jgi:hypothetical protein
MKASVLVIVMLLQASCGFAQVGPVKVPGAEMRFESSMSTAAKKLEEQLTEVLAEVQLAGDLDSANIAKDALQRWQKNRSLPSEEMFKVPVAVYRTRREMAIETRLRFFDEEIETSVKAGDLTAANRLRNDKINFQDRQTGKLPEKPAPLKVKKSPARAIGHERKRLSTAGLELVAEFRRGNGQVVETWRWNQRGSSTKRYIELIHADAGDAVLSGRSARGWATVAINEAGFFCVGGKGNDHVHVNIVRY